MARKTEYDKILSWLLVLYISLLPFEEALASTLGSILKIVGLIIVIYCLIRYLRSKFTLKFLQIFLIIWLIYSIISLFWSSSFYWWNYFLKIYIGQIGFFLILSMIPSWRISLKSMRFGMILGATIAALIILILPQASLITAEGRRTIVILGSELDPNIVCSIMILGIFSLMTPLFDKNNKTNLGINLILFLIISTGIFLTGSRGGIIAIIVGFIAFVFLNMYSKNSSKNRLKIVGTIVIIIVIIIIVWNILPKELISTRFSFSTILGLNENIPGVHNRYTIWKYALTVFSKQPLFGYGSGNFLIALSKVYRVTAAHNMYILLLVENGIFGLSLLLIPIFWTVVKLFKIKQYIVLSFFITILIVNISLDGITYKYFWISWLYAYIVIQQYRKDCKVI